jgi:hypothetical protein
MTSSRQNGLTAISKNNHKLILKVLPGPGKDGCFKPSGKEMQDGLTGEKKTEVLPVRFCEIDK